MKFVTTSRSTERRLSVLHRADLVIVAACVALLAAGPGSAADALETSKSRKTLVILGASYAKHWPISSIEGCNVINQGIGGNQSFEMRERFRTDVVDLEPDAVIIWGFINDLFRSAPEQRNVTKDRIRRSYEEMIHEAESHGIKVIIASEVSVREPAGILNWATGLVGRIMGKTSYQAMINQQVSDVNLWLITIAESRDILSLDFQNALADPDGQRKEEYAASDGSHLTSAAYDALSVYTIKNIQSTCDSASHPMSF